MSKRKTPEAAENPENPEPVEAPKRPDGSEVVTVNGRKILRKKSPVTGGWVNSYLN